MVATLVSRLMDLSNVVAMPGLNYFNQNSNFRKSNIKWFEFSPQDPCLETLRGQK